MVMAVQEKQETEIIVKWAIQEKLDRLASEISDNPITVDLQDTK